VKSSPPPDVAAPVIAPRPSRLAIAALSLVVVPVMVALFELLFGIELQPVIALPAVLGLILAHVALLRIRARGETLTGFGIAAAAITIGYGAAVFGAIFYALLRMASHIGG
jgi:hypothetical protein